MLHPIRFLGEGAFSKVYTHGKDAVKMSKIETENDLAAVAREHHVLRMNLPKTVPYQSCHFYSDSFHLRLDQANTTLSRWYRRQTRISYDKVRDIISQIIEGVHYMHRREITHRDLKPSNILLKGKEVWLCDFGLSRQYSEEHGVATGYMVTRWYRAPEIWKEQGYTKKVDMWSIGCILHLLMHGKVPGKTLEEIEKRVPELEGDTDLEILLKGLLKLDPKERWDSTKAVEYLEIELQEDKVDYPEYKWSESTCRYELFQKYYNRYPDEHRVLAHGLMLFDGHGKIKEEYMHSAMAIASMIFKTRPSNITQYSLDRIKALGLCPLNTTAKFLADSEGPPVSIWENFEGSFRTYMNKVIPNQKKRKYIK